MIDVIDVVEQVLATFRRKIPFFGGGRNERQKAKPAKLGVAGLRVDLG
jgi:hypothetical protein